MNAADSMIAVRAGSAVRRKAQYRATRGVWIWSGLVVILAWSLLSWHLLQTVRQREAVVRNQSAGLANALQMQIAQSLEIVDVAMLALASRIAAHSSTPQEIERILQTEGKSLPAYFSLAFIDAQGIGVAASVAGFTAGGSFADRDYFRAHLSPGAAATFVGGPQVGRTPGQQFFPVSRAVTAPDGRFLGVLMGSIEPKYMARIFDEFPQGPRSAIALAQTRTRQIVARAPNHDQHFARDISKSVLFTGLLDQPSGVYEVPTATDGVTRIIAYHQLKSAPFVVLVGFAREDLRDEFARQAWIYFAAGLLFTLVTLALAGQLQRRQRQTLDTLTVERELARARQNEALALLEKTAQTERFFLITPDLLCITDLAGRFVKTNRAWLDTLGYESERLAAASVFDFVHPDDREKAQQILEGLRSGQSIGRMSSRFRHADGSYRRIEWRAVAYGGQLYATARDVTEREQADTELRVAAAAFESQEAMMVTDAATAILRVNKAFTEITGYRPEEVIGRKPSLLKSGRHDTAFYRAMWDSINSTGGWKGEIWDRRKNGEIYPKWATITAVRNEQGQVTHYIGTHTDITERKRAEEKINALAFYDPLTGLPNRTLLFDRLQQAIAGSARSGAYGAMLFIDLDNFKTLNDTQGHDKGDLLLKEVARRLRLSVREEDTAARQGGDEFVVVLSGQGDSADEAAATSEVVAGKILAALGQPYPIGDYVHQCSASIGVTVFHGHRATVDDLMRQADLAMYRAKASGRNVVCFFDPAMEHSLRSRAELENDIRAAIERREFALHYQPQVLDDGRIVGAEALIRWAHPTRGMLLPGDFIPQAEESDLILPLGAWVIEESCRRLRVWAARPELEPLTLAVNVSARQFRQPEFVGQVLAIIARTGANPRRLKIELTESLLAHDIERLIETMQALQREGIAFSLDDFGTGYSSLSYLKRLPLDQLKIDQSFVCDVLTDANDAAIARTVVALGQNLGLAVIAEGVETLAQKDFLASNGCHAYQGFLFSPALPAEDFERLVRPA